MPGSVSQWVHWEVTYACPLRCVHCYTESGRRSAKQIPRAEMMRLADILTGMKGQGLTSVAISGGEPLLVECLCDVLDRLVDGGLEVSINTSGYGLTNELARRLARLAAVRVSVDGATAEVHDAIRGRVGSFAKALAALETLDELSRELRDSGGSPIRFGIDTVLTRSNFDQAPQLISDVARRFQMLTFLSLGAVIPIGLASRESYEDELLTDEQMRQLASPQFRRQLKAMMPPEARLDLSDNLAFQINPERPRLPVMTVEPDGTVRGLTAYEGSVGNLLSDPPAELWSAACRLRDDPRIAEQLSQIKSAKDWARAARNIDLLFASPENLVRISKRKPYQRVT